MSWDFGGKEREEKGLKCNYEFILLFKPFHFPPFPFKTSTHKHTVKDNLVHKVEHPFEQFRLMIWFFNLPSKVPKEKAAHHASLITRISIKESQLFGWRYFNLCWFYRPLHSIVILDGLVRRKLMYNYNTIRKPNTTEDWKNQKTLKSVTKRDYVACHEGSQLMDQLQPLSWF